MAETTPIGECCCKHPYPYYLDQGELPGPWCCCRDAAGPPQSSCGLLTPRPQPDLFATVRILEGQCARLDQQSIVLKAPWLAGSAGHWGCYRIGENPPDCPAGNNCLQLFLRCCCQSGPLGNQNPFPCSCYDAFLSIEHPQTVSGCQGRDEVPGYQQPGFHRVRPVFCRCKPLLLVFVVKILPAQGFFPTTQRILRQCCSFPAPPNLAAPLALEVTVTL